MSDTIDLISKPLGDIAKTFAGGTPSRAIPEFFGGNIPWVKSTEVNQSFVDRTEEHITDKAIKSSSAKWVKNGSVLVAMYGATAGQVSELKIDAATNQAVLAIDSDGSVSNKFIYYYLINAKEKLLYLAQGSGQPNLSKTLVDSLVIKYPSLDKQHKIAKILTTIDQLIEKTQALIDKHTAIKQGMMDDLFTRGIDLTTGQLRPPVEQAPHLYEETELGWIPKDWNVGVLNGFIKNIEQGWSPDCESKPADVGHWGVLKTTAVVWEGFNCYKNKALPKNLKPKLEYEIKVGDVLMTRAGPGNRVGVVAYVDMAQEKIMLSDKLYRIVPSKKLINEYLAMLLSSDAIQRQLNATKTGLAESQSNISQNIVKKLLIAVPIDREQNIVVERVKSISAKIKMEKNYLSKLKVQKNGLMQDLLTGEVKVA